MTSSLVLPFSNRPLFETADLDEMRAASAQLFGPVQWERVPGHGAFHCRMNRASLGPIQLVSGWFSEGASVSSSSDRYNVVFSLAESAPARAEHRRQRVAISAGQSGLFVTPGEDVDIAAPAHSGPLVLSIEPAALEAHFERLARRSRAAPLRFAPLVDITGGPGAALLRAVRFIADELEHSSSLLSSSLVCANAQDMLLSALLTCTSHDHHHVLATPTPPVSPAYVRRAEAYLAERAGEAVTVTDVASALGISVRALQVGFQRYRGTSPYRFLMERRLELARQQLLNPAPASTVALIASATGHAHVGRFSAAYRRRFGEAPRDTLRRIRGA